MKKKPPMYVVNTVLASVVLYYAARLSQSGRTAIDWTVIGLVTAAILWNLVQLGRRLHASGGAQALLHLQRTVLLWVIGLFNTALIRPEDLGSWKNWVGWVLLLIAAADTLALFRKERRSVLQPGHPT